MFSGPRAIALRVLISIMLILQDKVPLISTTGVHQLHIFIFVLAVFHVLFSILTMALGKAKVSLYAVVWGSGLGGLMMIICLKQMLIIQLCNSFNKHGYDLRTQILPQKIILLSKFFTSG